MTILEKNLQVIIKQVYGQEVENISLDSPPKAELGDYTFACFPLAKLLHEAPLQIAVKLKDYFDAHKSDFPVFKEMSVINGYLNFFLSDEFFGDLFVHRNEYFSFLNQDQNKGKTVVIDYIGANVGKPLHIGHMCTPNIGQALVNLYRKAGYKVIADSHIGDWGIIFGKLILAFKLWGSEQKIKENAINHLLELYIRITEQAEKDTDIEQQTRDTFKLLSEGDPESIKMWELFTRESIRFMNLQLARLNVKPDYNIGESFYEGLGLPKMENYPDLKWDMKSIVRELIEKGIATKNDDASVGVIFPDETKLPSCILQKRDGTHGYLASDLAALKYRAENWAPEKIIYSVDIRQELHFKQAFYIAKAAGWLNHSELFHAANGFISLKDGAMSTRTGRIIRLEDLLDEASERAKKIILEKRSDIHGQELENLSKTIGIGAIKYGYLSKNRLTNVVFDWDEFMTFEGNSGPYIQYAYVRSRSILEKQNYRSQQKLDISSLQFSLQERMLMKELFAFEQILVDAMKSCTPHTLALYAYNLTKSFNALYNEINIQNETNPSKKYFLLELVSLFGDTLKESFSILGIDMPERM